VCTAFGSFGQFLFLPATAELIHWLGWQGAVFAHALAVALILPLALGVRGDRQAAATASGSATVAQALREAVRDRSFHLLFWGFFTCGLQVVFIGLHLPAYLADAGLPLALGAQAIAIVGLFNVIGSLAAGWLGVRWSKKWLLAGIYVARSVVMIAFLVAPLSVASVWLFSAAMGLLWLSTVPLTNGLVGQIYGVRHLGLLGGAVFFGHQIGSFLGAWLGGGGEGGGPGGANGPRAAAAAVRRSVKRGSVRRAATPEDGLHHAGGAEVDQALAEHVRLVLDDVQRDVGTDRAQPAECALGVHRGHHAVERAVDQVHGRGHAFRVADRRREARCVADHDRGRSGLGPGELQRHGRALADAHHHRTLRREPVGALQLPDPPRHAVDRVGGPPRAAGVARARIEPVARPPPSEWPLQQHCDRAREPQLPAQGEREQVLRRRAGIVQEDQQAARSRGRDRRQFEPQLAAGRVGHPARVPVERPRRAPRRSPRRPAS
jgi:hypothetical protein